MIKTSKSAIQFQHIKIALLHTSYNYNKVSYTDDVAIVNRTTNANHCSKIKMKKIDYILCMSRNGGMRELGNTGILECYNFMTHVKTSFVVSERLLFVP